MHSFNLSHIKFSDQLLKSTRGTAVAHPLTTLNGVIQKIWRAKISDPQKLTFFGQKFALHYSIYAHIENFITALSSFAGYRM